jgi:ATP-dependent Clp protease adaptor protein ClpS
MARSIPAAELPGLPVLEAERPAPPPSTPSQPAEPATAVAQRPAPTRQPPKQLPQYRVLLHNDDVNDFDYVIASVVQLTPLGLQRAVIATMEAHNSGVALLMVTHKERAELVQEQFASKQLTVTIEPAE